MNRQVNRFFMGLLLSCSLLFGACSSAGPATGEAPKPPKGYPNEGIMKVAYALGMIKLVDLKPEVPEDIAVFSNLTYKEVDSLDLQLDIYRHRSLQEPAPLLVFIHGGSWKSGKRSDYLPYLIDFAKKGYVTATVSYRLSGVAPFPAAVEDVKCALRWLRAHAADYGIQPDRIALVGGSAGAHLAMMVGYADEALFSADCPYELSSKVQAVVNLYGPTDLTTPYGRNHKVVQQFLRSTYEEHPERFVAASPRTYISPGDPPTLTFQGTLDALVPYSQADSLDQWLKRAGVPHDYHKLKGWPHTMDASRKVNAYCQYYMDAFFEKYLR